MLSASSESVVNVVEEDGPLERESVGMVVTGVVNELFSCLSHGTLMYLVYVK